MQTWQEKENSLLKLGVNVENIDKYKQEQIQKLTELGVPEEKINSYYGIKQPTDAPIKKMIDNNIEKNKEMLPDGMFEDFFDFWQTAVEGVPKLKKGIEEGAPSSASVMMYKAANGEELINESSLPPDQRDTFYRVGYALGQVGPDIPLMIPAEIVGGLGGAAAGTAVAGFPVGTAVGALVGAGAMGNAVPEAIRASLVEFYNDGGKEPKDFLDKVISVAAQTSKAAVVGAVTGGVGARVGKAGIESGKVVYKGSKVATATSEIATMTALSAALEGEMPTAQSFWDNAILVGGLHTAGGVASKMQDAWVKKGIRPEKIAEMAGENPAFREELMQDGNSMPDSLKDGTESIQEAVDVTEILKKNVLELSKKEEAVDANKVELTDYQKANQKLSDKVSKSFKDEAIDNGYDPENIVTYTLDRFDIIKKIEDATAAGKDIDPNLGYNLLTNLSGTDRLVEHFVIKGTLDKDGNMVGKGLKEITDSVMTRSGEFQEAINYVVSKRFIQENKRKGIEKFVISLDEAKAIADAGDKNPKYVQFAKEITNFANDGLRYGEGILFSKEQVKELTMDDLIYIPWNRVFEEAESKKGKKSYKQIVKELKKEGSEKSLKNPVKTLVENIQLIIRETKKYEALNVAADEMVTAGMLEDVTAKDVKFSAAFAKDIESNIEAGEGSANFFKILQLKRSYPDPSALVTVKDGKVRKFTGDKLVIEVLKDFEGNPYWTNSLAQFARGVSSLKRAGITSTATFPIMNLIRDVWAFPVKADITPKEAASLVAKAISDIAGKTDDYWDFLSTGSGGALFKTDELMLDIYKRSLEIEADPSLKNSVRNVLNKPIDFYKALIKYSDLPVRMAEDARLKKEGKTKLQRAIGAREITVDFDKKPLDKTLLNYYTMTSFAKVGVNSQKNLVDYMKKDKDIHRRAFMYITIPAVSAYLANRDDERMLEVPMWERFIFLHVPLDRWEIAETLEQKEQAEMLIAKGSNLAHVAKDGKYMINTGPVLRIPMAHGLGSIYGTIPVLMLHSLMGNSQQDADKITKQFLSGFTIPVTPDLISPMIEHATNYNFFTETKLVPSYLEKELPYEQQTHYTSETAKQISKFLAPMNYREKSVIDKGLLPPSSYVMAPTKYVVSKIGPDQKTLASPIVIDHYIRSWTGGVGQYVVGVLDAALKATGQAEVKVSPEWSEKDIPFLGSFFTRYPSANSGSIEEFKAIQSKVEPYMATLKKLGKTGDMALEKFVEMNSSYLIDLSGFDSSINEMRNSIAMINADKENYTPKEKRQMIDSLTYMIIETSKMGTETYRQFEKEMKQFEKDRGL